MVLAFNNAPAGVSILNVGHDTYCEVVDSVRWITERLGLAPKIELTGGERGWIGDSPFIFLDCSRIRALGWEPALDIREAVIRTVRYLEREPWLMEGRE